MLIEIRRAASRPKENKNQNSIGQYPRKKGIGGRIEATMRPPERGNQRRIDTSTKPTKEK